MKAVIYVRGRFMLEYELTLHEKPEQKESVEIMSPLFLKREMNVLLLTFWKRTPQLRSGQLLNALSPTLWMLDGIVICLR